MRFSLTEEVKKNLSGSVGGNITLPDPLLEKGFLSYGRTIIAEVNKGEPEILEEIYMNKLHWDRNTGLFTLTDLQRNDSGIYTIDSKKGKVFTTSYKLTVYDSVAPPAVKKVTVSSEICSLLCSVDKETTLLWFKDEEILNQSSSALSLPLTVQQQDFSSSYRCVAANPAENKTVTVNVKAICGGNDTNSSDYPAQRNYIILFVIFFLTAALAIIIIIIIVIKRKHPVKNKWKLLRAGSVDAVLLYTDTRDSRQGGILPAVSGTSDRSSLTTVSYKLVDHHMITDPADDVWQQSADLTTDTD
ncbi:uncharacterized protein LOC115789126 [Archocentrus centrarchus]|uniref:uncharacterized protein LOC115789126 n=1 Tax=Archocentrus centrarchus TaxID=63155 RepID=UPI0011EA0991|nr:uncharacterized protein LOC115789126 [Archocentrus centrarchus]